MALSARFEAVVDGTDGDTYLNKVNAKFVQTSLTAKGAVTGTKGVKGRTVKLAVHIQEGRIEDLLRLAAKGDKPLLVGRVALRTDFELPPGDRDVIEKLQLAGTVRRRRGEVHRRRGAKEAVGHEPPRARPRS